MAAPCSRWRGVAVAVVAGAEVAGAGVAAAAVAAAAAAAASASASGVAAAGKRRGLRKLPTQEAKIDWPGSTRPILFLPNAVPATA
jgi:hypothetical protein